ncbi:hypothetical protein MAMC_02048 [Methylacidimicrobium cyclopophantes]|uniref:Uncharacterized protein n=1 Tax=Methylacidimicrobium cyclopophantes TaxID=1041766 RepID=A0A5E6MGR9_9BACT|nr:hypothetical protein [Methylacidimicrobium cyclopophantes]VVM08311.1 hypothetical protein MAMC_02048 [Methylacidimicrobium cyclopophantes]
MSKDEGVGEERGLLGSGPMVLASTKRELQANDPLVGNSAIPPTAGVERGSPGEQAFVADRQGQGFPSSEGKSEDIPSSPRSLGEKEERGRSEKSPGDELPASGHRRRESPEVLSPLDSPLRPEKRKPPLFRKMEQSATTDANGKAKEGFPFGASVQSLGPALELLCRLAGWTAIGLGSLSLVAEGLPALIAPSWWHSGAEERRLIGLRQEAEEILRAASSIEQESAMRSRLGPVVAAVAFSAVPSLLVDEMEIIAPSSTQMGRVQIKIRSFDADGMGAMATFGAMVGMALERSTGRKIRLIPTGLNIPYALEKGEGSSAEPIRAILVAPLRREDLQ